MLPASSTKVPTRRDGGAIIVTVSSSSTVADFACMPVLAPLTGPHADDQTEFRGNASAPDSPRTTNGIAGSSAGPLEPVPW